MLAGNVDDADQDVLVLKQCQERADQIVAERWDDIVTVADALLDRAVLNACLLYTSPSPRD